MESIDAVLEKGIVVYTAPFLVSQPGGRVNHVRCIGLREHQIVTHGKTTLLKQYPIPLIYFSLTTANNQN